MNISGLFSKIMGFLIIIITLALAPTINTANTAITGHDNVSIMIGMVAIGAFGAPLIIIGLLSAGGLFALSGVKGRLGGASMKDMIGVVGSVVVVIVGLTFMVSIMDYVVTLVEASTGFAVTIYEMIPLLIYLTIIASAGWYQYASYKRMRGGRGRRRAAAGY